MIEAYLYGGEEVVQRDDTHTYYWRGEKRDGVTSVVAIKSKGDKIIGWALDQAERYMMSHWDEESVRSEVSRAALLRGMKKAWVEAQKYSSSIGTTAHNWIEDHIKASIDMTKEPEWPDIDAAHNAAEAYCNWERAHSVRYVSSEKLVLSREKNYVGTLDVVAYVDGVLTLIDSKTSSAYRSEYALQTAGYMYAENEERRHLELEPIRNRMILMISKDDASFIPIYLPESRNQHDTDGFLAARTLHSWSAAEGSLPNAPKKKRRKKSP